MKHVALWGPSAAGKTALLAQLYLTFPTISGEWRIYPDAETQAFIDRERKRMVEAQEFPMGTGQEEGAEDKISYRFVHPASALELNLFTENRAGVWSQNLERKDVDRFIGADGLILLIDTSRQNYETEVERTLEVFHHALREAGRELDPRPIAVCMSKADRFIHTVSDLKKALERPDPFTREHLAPRLLTWIANFCPKHKLFPVSSVGVFVRHGVVRPAVFFDQRMRLRLTNDGIPVHLFSPFQWLFQELHQ